MHLLTQIQEFISQWFMNYTYDPTTIYIGVAAFMILTCMGLPLPEEIAIISLGLSVHIGRNPDLYPPPEGAGQPVTLAMAMLVAWGSVIIGDAIIFSTGRYVGQHPGSARWIQKFVHPERFDRVSSWMKRYGFWTAGIFRFLPGLRLPGHFSCGMLGVAPSRFILVDGLAATLSIPTQIYLIANYGDSILAALKKGKHFVALGILALLISAIVFLLIKRRQNRRKLRV